MNFLRRSHYLLACCLAWPVLLGARGCDPDPVPIGGDDCDPSRCGAELDLPRVTCEDGTVGGNTGRCLPSADGASCSWEIVECTPVDCSDEMCGLIPPTVPETQLSCERIADGRCEWVVISDPSCDPASCGPAPGTPSWVCADGTTGGFTGRCISAADGTCGWEIVDCEPASDCTLDECGPMLGTPAHVCADGSIGGNTGRCLRDPATAICGWEIRECPDPAPCGGFAGIACGMGEVCIQGVGECRSPDAGGVCIVPPAECTLEYAPVCGCDDHTYTNVCTAHAAGVSILHDGECAAETTECGGIAGLACPPDSYCRYEATPGAVSSCGAADGVGECQVIPTACPDHIAPVCGCDGVTYNNDCEAAAAAVSVSHLGAC